MRVTLAMLVAAAACQVAFGGARSHWPFEEAEAQQGDRWTWGGQVARGEAIEIKGVNGSITALPTSGPEVGVVATKRARRSDPDEVSIEVVRHEGGVTICAVYPGWGNRCEPGGSGRMSTRNNDVEVNFEVRVPRGVRFVGRNVNGGVEAAELDGPVEARTVNGGVRLETASGTAIARTVNGGITAIVRRAQGDEPLEFETVNGGITLQLPADLGADLEARTTNGTITTDFPVTVDGRLSSRRLTGRIGRGGRPLRVRTVNGSIRLQALP